jgi:subtilisin family serine protease
VAADFSGYGPNAAGRIKPDVCAMGESTTIFSTGTTQLFTTGSGTSFSTPQIAGWAACLWEAHPAATPAQIRHAIIKCASLYNTPDSLGQLGYGVPNFECTGLALNVPDTPNPSASSNFVAAMPNPFYSQVTLSVAPNTSGNVTFRLSDVAGREVFSFHNYLDQGYNSPFSIPASNLPPGIYILKAISSTQQQVLKLEKR